jgi:glucosamine--fructose-6-phosphate aminotransferase (isomerizing)
MCGIFGYLGRKEPTGLVIAGLKKLEYRGYDSWGIAVKSSSPKSGNFLEFEKHIGKIGHAVIEASRHEDKGGKKLTGKSSKKYARYAGKKHGMNSMPLGIGIGHTRWATHGGVTEENAHPHLSCDGKIAVVHNGIIENFEALRELLENEGHRFSSSTDTEVIAHLVEKFYQGNLEKAARLAISSLVGTYGLLIIHADEDKIVAARNSSPLVLGVGQGEYFLASDVSPIVGHTKRVVYLDDGDVLTLTRKGYAITDLHNVKKDKAISRISWSLKGIEKKGYKHFMLKEIFEQPESLMNTLRGRIVGGKVRLGGLKLKDEEIRSIGRILIIACGTSWHAGLVGEYMLEEYLRIPVEVEYASEFRYRNPVINRDDLVLAISQSGETADTLAALKLAKERGARTLGIVNVVGSTIAREAETGIYLHAGPEIGVASTKAFSCQVAALFLLTLYFAQARKSIPHEMIRRLVSALAGLPQKVSRTLSSAEAAAKKIAEKYSRSDNFLYLGRGYEFPVALEGALKLKEISYIHAEGYPAAEMKHGPIALIDEKMPVVFLAGKSAAYDKVMSNVREVRAREGKIIAIATKGDRPIRSVADDTIYIPRTIEPLMPVLAAIPLQLLAYFIADIRGCDIDKPRNLAKSVTVE